MSESKVIFKRLEKIVDRLGCPYKGANNPHAALATIRSLFISEIRIAMEGVQESRDSKDKEQEDYFIDRVAFLWNTADCVQDIIDFHTKGGK